MLCKSEQRPHKSVMLYAFRSLTRLENCSVSVGRPFDGSDRVVAEAVVQGEGWLCRNAGMKSGMVVFAFLLAASPSPSLLLTLGTTSIRCDKSSHEVLYLCVGQHNLPVAEAIYIQIRDPLSSWTGMR